MSIQTIPDEIPVAAPAAMARALPVLHIRPARPATAIGLSDLWAYRRLLTMMVWRDFKVRYAQSYLGGFWIVLSPLFNVLLYTFVFSSLAHMPSDQVPYALFNYVALIPWGVFSTCVVYAANCLVNNATLVQKIYFPRLMLPLHAVATNVPDLVVMITVQFLVLGLMRGIRISWKLLLLPCYIGWLLVAALAVGLILAALVVRYRELIPFIPILLQMWFYATPIAYPSGALPASLAVIARYNPMSWIANGFRWAILGTNTAPEKFLLVPLAMTFVMLLVGTWIFRATENNLADTL